MRSAAAGGRASLAAAHIDYRSERREEKREDRSLRSGNHDRRLDRQTDVRLFGRSNVRMFGRTDCDDVPEEKLRVPRWAENTHAAASDNSRFEAV